MLEVVQSVWREGYKAYSELVADNFANCGRSLGTAALGQVCIDGFLEFEGAGWEGGPSFHYVVASVDPNLDIDELEPLVAGAVVEAPVINIQLESPPGVPRSWWTSPLPPRPAGVLGANYGEPGAVTTSVEVFGDRPVTDLAYRLLATDLAKFGFVNSSAASAES